MSGSKPQSTTVSTSLHRLVAGLETIDLLVFTTFEYDPAFFEQNVLAALDPTLRGQKLQTVEDIRELEVWTADRNIAVFHDFGRIPEAAKKQVEVLTVPVAVEDGLFHPKVVLCFGRTESDERELRILVSSANLTYAGWGSNLEAGALVRICDEQTAAPAAALLSFLYEKARQLAGADRLVSGLEQAWQHALGLRRVTADDARPRLHVTIPASSIPPLWNRLAESGGPFQFVSPFFSGRPFFNAVRKHFADEEVTLVPGTKDGLTVELSSAELDFLKTQTELSLAVLSAPDRDNERRQHLKCFGTGEGVILGSHNATFAALGGPGMHPRNVEVSVEFPKASLAHLLEPTDGANWVASKEPAEPPTPVVASGDTPVVGFLVDWKAETVSLEVYRQGDGTLDGFEVRFPSCEPPVTLDEFEDDQTIPLSRVNRLALAENKLFRLHVRAGEFLYSGFVNELNGHLRTRYREPTVKGALQTWIRLRPDDDAPTASPDAIPFATGSFDDREVRVIAPLSSRGTGRLENYFFIFLGVRRMRQYAGDETAGDAERNRRIERLLYEASGSVENIIRTIQETLEGDSEADSWLAQAVPRGLLARELLGLLQQISAMNAVDTTELEAPLESLARGLDELVLGSADPTVQRINALLKAQDGA